MRLVVYGKPSGPWGSVLTAFFNGAMQTGFDPVWRNPSVFTADQTAECGCVAVLGLRGRSRDVLNAYRAKNVPVMVIDAGFVRREAYWQIGLNGLNWITPSQVINDRWQKLGVDIVKHRKPGGVHVLVCGQKPGDAQHGIDPERWAEEVITEIRRHTTREVVWRPHPGANTSLRSADRISYAAGNPIAHDLESAHCVVTYNSNSGHDALLAGVPVFCDPCAIYAECANLDLAEIESPKLPARSRYFYRLAYSQWTIDEMESGDPLAFIKRFMTDVSHNDT